jgi:hypothetical protein
MRTLVDARCRRCGELHIDVWMDTQGAELPACGCGGALERHHQRAAAVRQDSVPGGLWIEHGVCHADGSPRRFDSHSELARALKAKGLVNQVRHVPDQGSDRSKLTQRFV